MIWLLTAAAVVLATFLSIQRITFGGSPGNGGNGDAGSSAFGRQVVTINGWGQVRISSSLGDSLSSTDGPSYGVLFCGCAGLLVLAAIWQLTPRWRTRWFSPVWPAVAAAMMLLGSAATLVSEYVSQSARASDLQTQYQVGIGLYVIIGGGVTALFPWCYRHWQTVRGLPSTATPSSPTQLEKDGFVQDLGTSAF